jgi:hypothetical protein
MSYEEVARHAARLSYRDKMRLAQTMIQMGRKEEEEQNPDVRAAASTIKPDVELVTYVADRLRKLKAGRRDAVLNSIGAMFQFQGGISDQDKDVLLQELQRQGHLTVGANGRIEYPSRA